DFLRPFVLIGADHAIMNDNQPATPLKEFLESCAFVANDFHPVSGEDHDYIGVLELFGGREVHRAVGFQPALVEEFLPVGQEPRMIMLTGPVSLDAGPDEDTERFVGLSLQRKQGTEEYGESAKFHIHNVEITASITE